MPGGALVVIPAYNEAATIKEVVTRAVRHAPVLVVDDGSADRTGGIAAEVPGCTVLRHEKNTHIPGAILDGFRYALRNRYDYVVTMDAGLSHDPDLLRVFIQRAPSDVVLSYRVEPIDVPAYRRLLSRSAAFLVNAAIRTSRWKLWVRGYRDVTSGYRRYSARAMETILAAPLACRSFDFHLEALAVAHYAGLTIDEVPIRYTFSNSSLNRAVIRQAVRTWLRLWAGMHRPAEPRS